MASFATEAGMRKVFDRFDDWHREVSALGGKGYTLAVNISLFNPETLFTTYPKEWSQYYRKNMFMMRDPILVWGSFNDGATRWSDIKLDGIVRALYTTRVREVAAQYGLKYGAVAVMRNQDSEQRKAFLSVAREDRELTSTEIDRLSCLLGEAVESLRAASGLTRAEVEVLQLLATGRTQDEIAEELGISRTSVKKRIERARDGINATNSIHAVALAMKNGSITI